MMRTAIRLVLSTAAVLLAASLSFADDSARLLRVDHYVRVHSTVPAINGQLAQIYVREVVQAGVALRGPATDRVVLFVHGAGTPAEVSFDVPYQDYSWMAYLAHAGFDTFSMDMTGYGRSTRPAPMNDPCNVSHEQQAGFVPALIPAPCAASYPHPLTTIASDWNDLGAVIDSLRSLRHVEKVSLVAWSLGGPRAAGYTARHPEQISQLVLLAPAYNRTGAADPPSQLPADGTTMTTQSHEEFVANWARQTECRDQVDPAASDSVWQEMIASDPVGATWGPGVRRAPQVTSWGWNAAVVAKTKTPILMVTGEHDKQVPPDRVRDLYADLASERKVFVDLACSSHNAMWEKNHLLLFKASAEWLTKGSVNGMQEGMLKLGY
ncbi:MAG TPA: alpha/beta fold hydrolase [Bryobacteraceae bacterium]|nr:alpha/beta fold hydrolase [Bryobacteraceae bacterium]